jgi:hypothetical protein
MLARFEVFIWTFLNLSSVLASNAMSAVKVIDASEDPSAFSFRVKHISAA